MFFHELKNLLHELYATGKMCRSSDPEIRASGEKLRNGLPQKFLLYILKYMGKPLRIFFGFIAVCTILASLAPPYVWTSAVLFFIGCLMFWIAVPIGLSAENAYKYIIHRISCYLMIFVFFGTFLNFHENNQVPFMTKRQLEIREEMASERADERESYYHKSENAKRDKLAEEQALELEDDIEKENENQSNFYEELGPPKILYKCKNSDFEKALGATYGTYNSLLEKVSGICGAVGYEVIDNEK